MERQISSAETIIYRRIIPAVVNIICAPLACLALVSAVDEPEMIGFAIFLIGIAFYNLWVARNIKEVGMDDHFLYIYSGAKKHKTPLTNIAEVREGLRSRPMFVTLLLKQPAEFGKKSSSYLSTKSPICSNASILFLTSCGAKRD